MFRALLPTLLVACQAGGPQTVTLSGTAFVFGGQGEPVVGARVGIAEWPEIVVTTDDLGHYAVELPAGAEATPWAEADGFAPMYLQTFTPDSDLDQANMQLVFSELVEVYAILAGTELDPDTCQIASTVSRAEIQGLSMDDFVAVGDHGIEGAIGWGLPELPQPLYTSEFGSPDLGLAGTSLDGGVLWGNVEPGVYEVRAEHPDHTIDTFVATCRPGRFINAGPPWGLRELL